MVVKKTLEAHQAIDSEEYLLGAAILDVEVVMLEAFDLEGKDFHSEANGVLWELLKEMWREGEVVDLTTVAARVRNFPSLRSMIPLVDSWLSDLVSKAPTTTAVCWHMERVKRAKALHDLYLAASRIMEGTQNPDCDLSKLLERATEEIETIEEQAYSSSEVLGMGEILEKALAYLKELEAHSMVGFPTGIRSLDRKLLGLHRKGEITIIASRPGVGKSALALQFVLNMLKRGLKVGYISLEMDEEDIGVRMLLSLSGLTKFELAKDPERRAAFLSELKRFPFYLWNRGHTLEEVIRAIRRFYLREKCSVIFIDHFGLISVSGFRSEVEASSYIIHCLSNSFKSLVRKVGRPLAPVVLVQINREAMKGSEGRPKLHHLRSTGALEMDAGVVLGLYRPELIGKGEEGILEVEILKDRHNGQMGTVKLAFEKEVQRIYDLEGVSSD